MSRTPVTPWWLTELPHLVIEPKRANRAHHRTGGVFATHHLLRPRRPVQAGNRWRDTVDRSGGRSWRCFLRGYTIELEADSQRSIQMVLQWMCLPSHCSDLGRDLELSGPRTKVSRCCEAQVELGNVRATNRPTTWGSLEAVGAVGFFNTWAVLVARFWGEKDLPKPKCLDVPAVGQLACPVVKAS